MSSAINSALSGLNAASTRLSVSASNIANANSTDKNGKPVNALAVTQTSQANGGVKTSVSQSSSPVDLEQETVNQSIATYDFKANLNTIKVADETQQSLLNIIS